MDMRLLFNAQRLTPWTKMADGYRGSKYQILIFYQIFLASKA